MEKRIVDTSLDYLDPDYWTNGNLTISSKNKFNDSDAISDFSTSHQGNICYYYLGHIAKVDLAKQDQGL